MRWSFQRTAVRKAETQQEETQLAATQQEQQTNPVFAGLLFF